MLTARTFTSNDLATLLLKDTAEGVQYCERSGVVSNHSLNQDELSSQHSQSENAKKIVYAINDRVVFGTSRAAIQDRLRTTTEPIMLYLTSLPGEAVRASVSIVKCHGLPLMLVLNAHEWFIFVQSYRSTEDVPVGFGELSGQVFPGDVLLMVNGIPTRGMDVADVESLLITNSPTDTTYAVFVRPPSTKIRKANVERQCVVYDAPSQRTKETAFRAGLITPHISGPTSFEVSFQDGPLGLALALETRGVVVKSLNDHPDGTLGQASMSGHILRGDLVERVNGASYGQLSDLSQFTSWLLSLPRPLTITFSRQPPRVGTQVTTSEEANKRLAELLGSPSLLCKQLKLPTTSDVKTYRVESFPLPFEAENLLASIGVIAIKGLVYCEQYPNSNKADKEASVSSIAVGDLIVGLNGRSVAGLSWETVKALCAEMSSTCPVYLHFTQFVKSMTLLQAHEPCVESANAAWSECGYMLSRLEKAREIESFIKWVIIPRTLAFGKSRHGYSFFRFFSDNRRLFILSPEKKWSVCATRDQLFQLLSYLDEDSRDSKVAAQIRWCFHGVLHSESTRLRLQKGSSCGEYSSKNFLRDGPFSIKRQVLLAMDGDMEKYESLVSYYGRTFFIGSFYTQQEAESALTRAETSIHSTGLHAVVAADVTTLRNANFPSSLVAPRPKAENVVKRIFSRNSIPISHDVYQIIKRGLLSNAAMLNSTLDAATTGMYQAGMPPVAMPRMQGDSQSSAYAAAQSRYLEALKRKHAQTENPYALQIADQLKRTRYADSNEAARMQQQLALDAANNAVSFKRSLQALVDQGRLMLAAWNQFAISATVQTTNRLACSCLSSFEEIKKVVSRIVVDPKATHPDPKTFVCLHHAYVMGLICAMATQALTTSQKTHSDSALVKQVADAFVTAILSCVDPSNMLRARALSGFATAAKKCEPSQRAGDLSVELRNVANFVLMFLRTTQYLSGSSFDDVSNCRSLFTSSTPGVESLPASFVQQINLLENIRQAFYRKTNTASSGNVATQNQAMASMTSLQIPMYDVVPGSTSISNLTSNFQTSNQASNDGVLIDVEFGFGPLGVVINYSNHGTIIITEFSNDNNNTIGQAQASGKVQVGDEVYAINGNKLEVIGMEGFKAAVATSKRPLQVTFRRQLTSVKEQNPASSFRHLASAVTQGTTPSAQNSSAMNEQVQQPSAFNQPRRAGSIDDTELYGNQHPGSERMATGNNVVNPGENYQKTATPEHFSGMDDNMNLFPFPSASSSQPMGDSSLQYDNLQLAGNMSDFMGDISEQTFPTTPTGGTNYDTMSNVYNDDVASAPSAQNTRGIWQGASNPMLPQSFPSGSAPNPMNMGGDGDVQMSMDSVPLMPDEPPSMGYSSTPPSSSGGPDSYQSNNSTGEFVSFVAGNDPQLPPNGDPSQVNYYDANKTIYRGASDYEIDTNTNTSDKATTGAAERSATADVDTEPESISISQATTPAQSDTDGERSEIDRQRDREVHLVRLQDELQNSLLGAGSSSELSHTNAQAQNTPLEVGQTAETVLATTFTVPTSQSEQADVIIPEGKPPLQTTRVSPRVQAGGKELRVADGTGVSRRSSRVSRKITNIADMYDPDYVKAHSRGGAGSGSEGGMEEPTDGEIGELATELLEVFSATIRPLKKGLPRSLLLLRAQLLAMESAIPRDAFRSGRWGRPIRAAWAEMVYACDTSANLMEAVVFLEANIDPEWLDPCWKTSPLPSAKNAITTATIASAAMRLYSLDDAISYGRMKRGGKRKHRNATSANRTRPSSLQKTAIFSQESKAAERVLDPSELPFVSGLSTGVVGLANTMIHNILQVQRERSSLSYASRKARSKVAAITSLTEDQVERWIQASSVHQAHTVSVSQSQSASGRHATLKKKHSGFQTDWDVRSALFLQSKAASAGAHAPAPVATPPETQYVELHCFQMKTLRHCFPMGSAQDITLRSRLEHVLDVVLRNELALAFLAPVNVNDVPGYADLIKHPMDLGTIRSRLSRGFYDQRFEMLVQDVNLVWENCFTFNCLDADISKCANRLRSIFNRLFEQCIADVPPNTPVSHLASEELCRAPPLPFIPPNNWYCPRCPIKKFTK
ncbi:unnamed protein product [Peronospora destructor]|uniref:Uncharacterized protein n=1 Tax=Peronospora destructor TaxID=86335 RepID=A0AAV0UYP6_9STRA|nr:unnamed protein product [Peronospora destructor]